MSLRLVVFDVDGTLVDSQGQIHQAMEDAFAALGLTAPDRAAVRGIIGLSLPQAMAVLAPDVPQDTQARLVTAYKEAYFTRRTQGGAEAASPLYPGARAALEALAADEDVLLAVATGKSRRGLEHLLDAHDLRSFFISTQVADDHPSKPHPSMLWQVLSETGVEAAAGVMLGDTSFDMEMGRAAGLSSLGVSWGYHPAQTLRDHGAVEVLPEFGALLPALNTIWRMS